MRGQSSRRVATGGAVFSLEEASSLAPVFSGYENVPRKRDALSMPRLGILGRTQQDSKVKLCHFVELIHELLKAGCSREVHSVLGGE